jgi:hypothetical protein
LHTEPETSSAARHDRIVVFSTRIDQILWEANFDRQGVMTRETIASLLRFIIEGEELAWARSSSLKSGFGSISQATFALCARVSQDDVCIAITRGPQKDGSPGRAWRDLKPWRPNTIKTAEKLARWLKQPFPDRVRLSLSEAADVANELPRLPVQHTRWHHLYTSDNEIIIVSDLAKIDGRPIWRKEQALQI